jgi:hypothetical protein
MGPGLLATSALPLALIHRVADQEGSRILLFTLSGAYALGPVPRGGDSSREERLRPAILLHVWMDIHSKSLRRLLRFCCIGKAAYVADNTILGNSAL